MVSAVAAVLAAALSVSPAIRPVDAPPMNDCDYRVYYLPFPPAENGHAAKPPVINGQREKDDSFVVTVKRQTCSGGRMVGVGAHAQWIDNPSQRIVTWSATVTPTKPYQATPPASYLKGPTFRMGPDGETVLQQHK